MKLSEIIPEGGILEDLKSTVKEDVIKELVTALVKAGRIEEHNLMKVVRALMDREVLGSTGIGAGVAVPHARNDALVELVGAIGRSKAGVEYDSLDGKPAHVFFMLLSSKGAAGASLESLAYISRLVRDNAFIESLHFAEDTGQLRSLLAEADRRLGGI